MGWVKFEKGRGKMGLKSEVSVAKKGSMSIAADLVENFEGAEYAVLYFNAEAGLVGIACHPKIGYKLRRMDTARSYQIQVAAFVREHGILKGVYAAEWDEDEGMIIFSPKLKEDE